jgi:hypothetical protein
MSTDAPKSTISPGPMLPVVGLVLSVVGLCLPPLLLVAFGIGLYSLFRSRTDPAWLPRKQIAQMTMAVSAAGTLVLVGLLLPNIKRAQFRIAQMECQKRLGAIYAAEQAFYAREKRYTTKVSELGIDVPKGRGILRFSAEGPLDLGVDETQFPKLDSAAIDDGVPKLMRGEVGIKGECPACSITVLCATNLDADPTVDVWTVSSIERTGSSGEKMPGGIPWCEVDDLAM